MKGAMAEVCTNTTIRPRMNSSNSIGVSHHHLVRPKKPSSSEAVEARCPIPLMNFIARSALIALLAHQVISQHQHVDTAARKGTERLGGSVDDGLAAQIERGVQQNRHAGQLAERLD